MTDIWLVRHGEAAASWEQSPDPGLSALGHQQARAAAEILHRQLPNEVSLLTIPKARARETGEPLALLRQSVLVEHPAFTEVHAPVPMSARKVWLREFMGQRWSEQPAPLWQWRNTIADAMRTTNDATIVFTHFLVINAVLAECRGRDEVLQAWPANGSIYHFRMDAGRIELVALGEQMESVVN